MHFVFKREWVFFTEKTELSHLQIKSSAEMVFFFIPVNSYFTNNNFKEYFPLKEQVYIMPCVFNCVL